MEENSKDNLSEQIWRVFSSMKLGLALLGILIVVSAIGTVVPQMGQSPEKAQQVSQIWKSMGFTNLYSAVWFRLLLGALCINLIVCSIQRFTGIYQRTYKLKPPTNLAQVSQKNRQEIKGKPALLRESVQAFLKQEGFKVTLSEESNHWSFIAIKRRLGNWGSLITHLSFVVLVIGALIGSIFGFKGYFMEGPGSTLSIQEIQLSKGSIAETFSVRINSAEDRFLPNGERDNWYTDMSIIENGQEVARKTLSVNHPFKYEGITFYQANFANGVDFTADMNGQEIPILLYDQGQSYFQAPGTDLYLVTAIQKGSAQKVNALYQIYKGAAEKPVQTGMISMGETIDVQGTYQLTFNGIAGFTGLQVKKDPGVGLIWLGSGLLLAGLILAFYWQPVVISGILQSENEGQGSLTVGALSGKMPASNNESLEQFVSSISKLNKVT